MGGLRKYMPITYWTMLIGAISQRRHPGLRRLLLQGHRSSRRCTSRTTPGASFAYFCVLGVRVRDRLLHLPAGVHDVPRQGALRTPCARPRAPRARRHGTVTSRTNRRGGHVPLILLAIPSVCAGWLIGRVLFGDYFGDAIVVGPSTTCRRMAKEFHGVLGVDGARPHRRCRSGWRSPASRPPGYLYMMRPDLPAVIARRFGLIYALLERKYGFDELYSWFFAGGARALGTRPLEGRRRRRDRRLMVNGSARLVGWFAGVVRRMQSGLHLPLRVRDDLRRPRAAHAAGRRLHQPRIASHRCRRAAPLAGDLGADRRRPRGARRRARDRNARRCARGSRSSARCSASSSRSRSTPASTPHSAGMQFVELSAVDRALQRQLPPRHRRHLAAAHPAQQLHHGAGGDRRLGR